MVPMWLLVAAAALAPVEPKVIFRAMPTVVFSAPLLAGFVVGTLRSDRKVLSALLLGLAPQVIGLVVFITRGSSSGVSLSDQLVADLVVGVITASMGFVGLLTVAGLRRLRTARIAL